MSIIFNGHYRMKHRTWITEALRLHFEEHLPQVVVGVAWAYQNQQLVVCSCAFAKLAFHGLCPRLGRSGTLMAVFTGVPPQYLSYFVVDR